MKIRACVPNYKLVNINKKQIIICKPINKAAKVLPKKKK